jgi:transposase
MNYQDIKFSEFYSNKRIKLANKIIGIKIVKWILAFALYLFGATRQAAAKSQGLSYNTFKSFTERIEKDGFSAFFDKRSKNINITKSKPIQAVKAYFQDDHFIIYLGMENRFLKIPTNNYIQIKTVLLSFYRNKLIDKHTVAELLGYSTSYIQKITRKLFEEDAGILLDQRQGQKKDYVVTPYMKSELIQQFTANVVLGKKTSSSAISQDLKKRCNITLVARTIRFHIEKLGLSKIKHSLIEIIEAVKKTPKNNKYK